VTDTHQFNLSRTFQIRKMKVFRTKRENKIKYQATISITVNFRRCEKKKGAEKE